MFCNTKIGKEYTDLMEMHILELSKLPTEEKNETSLLQWMRFLGGKTRKDFEEMAKKNSELEEAYDVLDKLSADEKKRLEYETRQRAIRDYNIGMLTAERRGIEAGRKIGMEEGREEGRTEGVNRINQLNIKLSKLGRTEDILKAVIIIRGKRKYFFLLPLSIRAGYHFSNHAVKSPINIGIRLFTRISTFPNPAFLNRKVQIAVSTYSVPHAAARI